MPPFSQTHSLGSQQPSGSNGNGQQLANNLQYPALSLYPYNDTFIPKHIFLNGRVKIGRQTNAKTVPGERNGYFDSKVLSRQHAEVWEENGKIFIKDVKSSNGTFVNSDRLSPEGVESDPMELKTNDIVEFGIDIVGDDNKTIIHHKVSARVVCILSAEDAMHEQQQMASAANAHTHQPVQHFPQQPQHPAARRPTLQPSLGGMGGPTRPKSSISFEHVLIRLQGELNRSRETTSELHGLTEAMNDISDALGGAVPPPPVPASLPPVRTAPTEPQAGAASGHSPSLSSAELSSLHSQLSDTRSSLATHAEKVREFEGVLAEHDNMKRELAMLRELMEARERREAESKSLRVIPEDDDDDDARSIRTIVPGDDDDRREMVQRPGTPEPGMQRDDDEEPPASPRTSTVDDSRLNSLALQLESAIELSKSLVAQHTVSQETIRQLEERVKKLGAIEDRVIQLESAVKSVQEAPSGHSEFESRILNLIGSWKEDLDGRWTGMQEDWETERRRLNSAKEEFEKRASGLEEGLGAVKSKVNSLQVQTAVVSAINAPNGSAKGEFRGGLVTPPSPRSMSVDSQRKRRRSRAKRQPSRDSLSDSDAPSRANVGSFPSVGLKKTESEGEGETSSQTSKRVVSMRSDVSSPPSSTAYEEDIQDMLGGVGKMPATLPTPEASTVLQKEGPLRATAESESYQALQINPSTLLGCIIVGAAAAAVYWRTHE